jgi:hypothetical protein
VNSTATARVVATVAQGTVFGAMLGVAARGWMRLVSADPEFSWSGTVFIVGAFVVWGFTVGVVAAVRQATSRRWLVTMTRIFGLLGTFPLFLGAGAIMAPTVIGGGLAMHRTDWKTGVRWAVGVIALIPVVVVAVQINGDWGWTWRWWTGMAGLGVIYGTLLRASRDTMAPQIVGWRLPRFVWIAAAIGTAIVVLLPIIGMGLS